jgi:uncharacterized protein YggT (Ycf19 family)
MGMLISAIGFVAQVLIWALIGRAILSWFANPYTANRMSSLVKIYSILVQVTEPLIRPSRRLLARFNTGPVDLSLFVTVLFIVVIRSVVIRVLLFLM